MSPQDESAATDRLRRALLAFQAAQNSLLGAHRRLKELPQAEVDAFWRGPGRRLEAGMRTTATEVVAAFQRFSRAGLVAGAGDRHLVTQAQRVAVELLDRAVAKGRPLDHWAVMRALGYRRPPEGACW